MFDLCVSQLVELFLIRFIQEPQWVPLVSFSKNSDWLSAYGVDHSRFDRVSRETLPVAERLALVLDNDARPLIVRRPPRQRRPRTGLPLLSPLPRLDAPHRKAIQQQAARVREACRSDVPAG